ncbi:PHD finger protein ALFIN-LIKE 4-like [Musa acuminata AAA Group]|uniref:PHD finger protein ALFIN-LIKE 4-like n=1 Tax=Musa acuminata AAA Group TaxID=214697 RepID=UPI0031DB6CE3
MDEEKIDYYLWTVDQIFRDFLGRRAGLIKALTTDFNKFYTKCDPEKPKMCLYGRPNETWKVKERPLLFSELPEPHSGINCIRDGMLEKDWLAHVAIHSDAWIISLAFYIAARAGCDHDVRQQLFNMINSNPTLYEIVSGTVKMPAKEETSNASRKDKSRSKKRSRVRVLGWPLPSIEEEEDVEDEAEQKAVAANHSSITCGACGRWFSDDTEYWILCDVCGIWYHGNCVRVTPERYKQLKRYRCPGCCRHKRERT